MIAVEYLTFIRKLGGLENREIKARIEELLHIVKLTDSAKRRISVYSGGMLFVIFTIVRMNKVEVI